MNDAPSFTIIPAHPGHRVIYLDESGLILGEGVIAWRIETARVRGEWFSSTVPICASGEPASNWGGLLRPDGSADVQEREFDSFDQAQAHFAELTK